MRKTNKLFLVSCCVFAVATGANGKEEGYDEQQHEDWQQHEDEQQHVNGQQHEDGQADIDFYAPYTFCPDLNGFLVYFNDYVLGNRSIENIPAEECIDILERLSFAGGNYDTPPYLAYRDHDDTGLFEKRGCKMDDETRLDLTNAIPQILALAVQAATINLQGTIAKINNMGFPPHIAEQVVNAVMQAAPQ
jgi:hypothetical protein